MTLPSDWLCVSSILDSGKLVNLSLKSFHRVQYLVLLVKSTVNHYLILMTRNTVIDSDGLWQDWFLDLLLFTPLVAS